MTYNFVISEMVLQKLSNPSELEDTLSELRKGGTSVVVPSKSVFVTLARFLTHEDMHIQEVVTHYFMHLAEHRRRHVRLKFMRTIRVSLKPDSLTIDNQNAFLFTISDRGELLRNA